jgi:hypothetical protein
MTADLAKIEILARDSIVAEKEAASGSATARPWKFVLPPYWSGPAKTAFR